MLKLTSKPVLLMLIFAFSFIFRMMLMLWGTFPSGADIGLHNSVIYSITGSENQNFLWNFYQIGGGLSLTFPGYHIFTSSIMMMTGLPEYIAHAVVVSLFSALTVLCAFLITKVVWNEPAGFIVAFLVAISRFDIEMTLWGGYPNVITLCLIPLTFYLFLLKDRFSKIPYLASTAILAGSIFITHSLSAAIFAGVTVLTVLLIFIAPRSFSTTRKTGLYWLLPLILGVLLVSPFVVNAIPVFFGQNSSAPNVSGVEDINSAVLSTRILPLTLVIPLFALIAGFAAFSKRYHGKFSNLPVLLLCSWLFVPLILTQGYLVGFIIDYNRFLYFVILPALMFIAVLVDYGSAFFANMADHYHALTGQVQAKKTVVNKKLAWLSAHLSRKALYGGFVLFFLLFSFIALPIFMTPYQNVGQSVQSFYQFMDNPSWDAIQWVKENTPADSVFVADPHFGWWLGGFAQRPTMAAVDPQYLTLAREVPYAKNASNILDTDYLVDNQLVQVREDGGYIARHNPEILAKLNWTYFPYSFFNFDGSQTEIRYRVNEGTPQSVYLSELTVTSMRMEKDIEHATVIVSRGNGDLNYTQYTTVYKGQLFVNITSTVNSTVPGVAIDWVNIGVQSKGTQIQFSDERTIALIDVGVKTFGQIIFKEIQPRVTTKTVSPLLLDFEYNLQGSNHGQIQIMASAYSADNNPSIYANDASIGSFFVSIIAANLDASQAALDMEFKEAFDYKEAMQNYGVSYIVCTTLEMQPKFASDPAFSLVFINTEVAIFKVKGNLNQDG